MGSVLLQHINCSERTKMRLKPKKSFDKNYIACNSVKTINLHDSKTWRNAVDLRGLRKRGEKIFKNNLSL